MAMKIQPNQSSDLNLETVLTWLRSLPNGRIEGFDLLAQPHAHRETEKVRHDDTGNETGDEQYPVFDFSKIVFLEQQVERISLLVRKKFLVGEDEHRYTESNDKPDKQFKFLHTVSPFDMLAGGITQFFLFHFNLLSIML